MLTPKQEKFCREVASGKSYIDAYLSAYDWNGSKPAANLEAMKLANREDIQEKIKSLLKPIEAVAQTTALTEREKKRQWLWDMIDNPEVDDNNRLRAMDILNKMDTEYTNINVNHSDNGIELKNLDLNALKALAE